MSTETKPPRILYTCVDDNGDITIFDTSADASTYAAHHCDLVAVRYVSETVLRELAERIRESRCRQMSRGEHHALLWVEGELEALLAEPDAKEPDGKA